MKQVILLILIFTGIFNIANNAQAKEDSLSNHSLHFFILEQAKLAYKYNLTNVNAIRFCLDVGGLFKKNTEKNIVIRNDQIDWSRKNRYEVITSRQFYSFTTNYIHKLFGKKRYNIYSGIGPMVKLEYYQDESRYDSYESDNSMESHRRIDRYYNWYFGGSVILGIEAKIYDYLALLAEYEATLTWGWKDRNENYTSTSNVVTKNENYFWEYKLNSIRIGIGVYL